MESMLRNLAAQTFRDFELVIADAQYEMNAAAVKELSETLGLTRVIHTPAMEARHVGRWMHWELYSNAMLLASGQWVLYYGVHRYLHRKAMAEVASKAASGVCTVLYQNNTPYPQEGDTPPVSFDEIEEFYTLHLNSERWPYLSQTGFFSVPRDIMINRLNGYNEALLLHHWADTDLAERARHLSFLRVEVMSRALLRITHPKDSGKETIRPHEMFPSGRQPCTLAQNPSCVVWQLEMLRDDRHIEIPVQRVIHDGFEWVRCDICGAIGVEDVDEYMAHLSSSAFIRAPIGICGIGRNLFSVDADLQGLELADKIKVISGSHDNPKYLH